MRNNKLIKLSLGIIIGLIILLLGINEAKSSIQMGSTNSIKLINQ